jgi:hypothetical protein
MKKFVANLSASGNNIRQDRAAALAQQVEIEQDTLVNSLRMDLLRKEAELNSLADLGPSTTYDLRVGGKEFNPKAWVTAVQACKVELLNIRVQLELAEETRKVWFTDEPDTVAAAEKI